MDALHATHYNTSSPLFFSSCSYLLQSTSTGNVGIGTASPLEKLERLEQLRALENGMQIAVAEVPQPGPAIDVPADIRTASVFLKRLKGK